MNIRTFPFLRMGACLAALSICSLSWAQDTDIPPKDLGVREAGQSYPFKLIAKNINCSTPQDFEFIFDKLPWLTTPAAPVIKQLGPGESRTIQANLDFKYTPKGIHYGRLTSTCLTCGWDIFAACEENGQDVVLKVNVQDPSQPNAKRLKDKNPYAGIRPAAPMNVTIGPQVSEADIEALKRHIRNAEDKKTKINAAQQRRALRDLKEARDAIKTAIAGGQGAQTALRNAQRAKSDCERRLAELKSKAEMATRRRKDAKQDARNAEATAKRDREAHENFEKDNKPALQRVNNLRDSLTQQKKYSGMMANEDGIDSERYKNSEAKAADIRAKYEAAKIEQSAILNSKGQRELAAKTSKAIAAMEAKKAEDARKAETIAIDAYKAQIKICEGKADAMDTAQDALDDAKKHAIKAVREVNAAELKAAQVTIKTLDEQIKARRKHCETKREKHEETMKKLVRALKAGQKLTILQDTGKAKPASIQAVNAKIWNAVEDMAKDKAQIVTVDPAKIDTKDTAETVLNNITGIMGNAASALQGSVKGAIGTSDFHVSELLGGLNALAYTAQSLVAANRNPNSNWRLRDELLRDTDSYWYQQMRAKKIGKDDADRKELMKHIDEIQKNPDYIQNTLRTSAKAAAQCLADIQTLKDQKAALEKRFKT